MSAGTQPSVCEVRRARAKGLSYSIWGCYTALASSASGVAAGSTERYQYTVARETPSILLMSLAEIPFCLS